MNDFEHLQSIYRQIHNQQVNELFRNVDVPENIEDIRNIPAKAGLKKACLIKDSDSASTMDMRVQLFNIIKGKEIHIFSNLDKISTRRRHKPKVTLYFMEDLEDVEESYSPVEGQIGFRLMNVGTDNDISEAEARTLANRIKSLFGANDGFV
ncbi:hypothetical protein [Microseira sp. BLCC-F43]|jgi:hypothetical protein|uniref:hypothetical protein n=1 Tax=Microseira sp. BLCC-F43 TaxID=3153602 RepID=UPI0035B6B473